MESRPTLDGAIRPQRRSVVIVVSLGIAVLSTSLMVGAFTGGRDSERSGVMASEGPVRNGSIYFRAENNQGQSMSGIVEPDGTGVRDAFPGSPAAQHEQIAFSADGTRMAYVDGREGQRGIYVAKADGSEAVKLTDQVNDSWPNWSPDGAKIAFVGTRFDPSIGFCNPGVYADCLTDIYTMNADGSDITDVTGDPRWEFDPVWSPDGTRIAFASTPVIEGLTAITVMNADGSDRMTLSSSNGGSDFDPRWSPDGTQIVFGAIHYENWGLFQVRPDGTEERTLLFGTGTHAVAPAWSPDGSLIAFGGHVGDHGPLGGVFTMRPDGSGITKLADLPDGWSIREIVWGPTPALTPTATVTGVFDVGMRGRVSGLTYGFGSLWVDGFEGSAGDGRVIRLDAETGEQLADISIGSVAPGWEVGGGGIAVGDGSLWVVGTEQVPGGSPGVFDRLDTVLVRIDPSTNRVADRIVLGWKGVADVAIDANGVWVLFVGDDDKMEVARVDPALDRVVATIPLQQAYGHYLFSVGGSIVAMTNETGNGIGDSVINVIDPSTDTVTTSVPLGAYLWPAAGDGSLWASGGTTLIRIDPSSGDIIGRWPLESTGDSLSVGAGGVWSVSPRGGRGTISRWSPVQGTTDLTIELPPGQEANVIATSSDVVWVLGFDGSITRIRLGTG